jgi:hypothetical protein
VALNTRSSRKERAESAAVNDTRVETHSLPTLTRSYPRRFTFYVADPISSIQFLAADTAAATGVQLLADSNGQFGGTTNRIAPGTASYRTLENRTGSPSRLTGIISSG